MWKRRDFFAKILENNDGNRHILIKKMLNLMKNIMESKRIADMLSRYGENIVVSKDIIPIGID